MVAKPPTMIACSSLIVMSFKNGFTSSGASVWPTNTLPHADSDSLPDVPSRRTISHAICRTTNCITPRW